MIIGIPVYQGVDLLDVTGPHEVLGWVEKDNFEIRLIAETKDVPIITRDKFSFNVSHTFADTPHLDVLWVPGGNPEMLAPMMNGTSPAYVNYLISCSKKAQWICSVCEGALLLAAAGLLDGYLATTHWAFIPCLKEFHQIKVAEGHPRFVLDRNRLTGGGISSGLDESLRLVELLTDTATAQGVQQSIQYYPCPPVTSQIPPAIRCPFNWQQKLSAVEK